MLKLNHINFMSQLNFEITGHAFHFVDVDFNPEIMNHILFCFCCDNVAKITQVCYYNLKYIINTIS